MRINKKGDSEQVVWPEVIFIILTLIYSFVLIVFIRNSFSDASIMEEIYAKKIALIIDSSYQNSTISFDATKLYEVAIKSGRKDTPGSPLISIDDSNNLVRVSISNSSGGYKYHYFSDHKKVNISCYVVSGNTKVKYKCSFYALDDG